MAGDNPKTHHWVRPTISEDSVPYMPLGAMATQEQMLARAGSPVKFAGIAYYNEPQGAGRLLGVADESNPAGKPVLVLIDQASPTLPPDAHVIVRGRLAREPYASAG